MTDSRTPARWFTELRRRRVGRVVVARLVAATPEE
jgi:hypothetical protein